MLPFPGRRRALLAAPALSATIALCAAITPVARADESVLADSWKAADAPRMGLHKVLVVGLTPDDRARRKFEDRFVTLLRSRDTDCLTSYAIVPDLKAERDPAAVRDALFARQVDGVITVGLVPLDDTTEEAWAAAWRESLGRAEPARSYVESALRGLDPEAKEFGVEVALWSMQEERRIWGGRFPGQSLKYLRKHASEMVALVIDEMRHESLF